MKKSFFVFVFLGVANILAVSTNGQNSKIVKNPNSKTNADLMKPNQEGCRVRYIAGFKRDKPSDMASAIAYGFGSFRGKNGLYARIEYSCLPVIRDVMLSETVITTNCDLSLTDQNDFCTDQSESVEISTDARDPDGDPLVYQYFVSSGKIVGSGSKVIWDLTGVQPGIYKVFIGVDDGCGVCTELTIREVKVIEGSYCQFK